MGQNTCLVPFNTLIFASTGRSMKNFSGEKKSFFLTRPTCSLGEIAPQALWRSRGAPKTSNQLLWVYYTVIRLIGPSWGHLGAHRGPKGPFFGPKWGWFSPPLNIGMWGVQTGAMKIPAPTARFQIIYFLVPWGPLTVTLLCSSIIWS